MKIGIDARFMSRKNLAGIGLFVKKIIEYFNNIDDENEYYLYTNKQYLHIDELNLSKKFHLRIIPSKVGTLSVLFKWHKEITKDGLDIFWGTEQILPRSVKETKYVLTIHDLAIIKNPKWGKWDNVIIQNMLVRGSSKRAHKIFAMSENTKKDIIKILKCDPNKITVTYCPLLNFNKEKICSDDINTVLKRYRISSNYFLFIGTIEPRKNVDTLIKAFNNFCVDYDDIDLVIVGKLGWKPKRVLTELDKSPFKDRIVRPGYITEKEKNCLLKGCLAFVFPSHYEGFGSPLLEAMANETLIISAKNSSLPEVAGNAAIYVEDENNFNHLARALKTVATMPPNIRKVYVDNGKDRVDFFSIEKTIGKMYTEIIYLYGI